MAIAIGVIVVAIAIPLTASATMAAVGPVAVLALAGVGIPIPIAAAAVLIFASTEGASPPSGAPIYVASGIAQVDPVKTFIPLLKYYCLPILGIGVLIAVGRPPRLTTHSPFTPPRTDPPMTQPVETRPPSVTPTAPPHVVARSCSRSP